MRSVVAIELGRCPDHSRSRRSFSASCNTGRNPGFGRSAASAPHLRLDKVGHVWTWPARVDLSQLEPPDGIEHGDGFLCPTQTELEETQSRSVKQGVRPKDREEFFALCDVATAFPFAPLHRLDPRQRPEDVEGRVTVLERQGESKPFRGGCRRCREPAVTGLEHCQQLEPGGQHGQGTSLARLLDAR